MKKTKILQSLSVVFALLTVICVFLPGGKYSVPVLAVAGIVCTALSLAETNRQERIMNFLLQESRKGQKQMPAWQDGETEKLELLRRRVELSTLQNQINPHFLYNTLDSIRSQALLDGQKDIASMTEKLSKFFRYCISNKENMVKIREEANHILDYYYIQKYRFEDRFELKLEVEEEGIYDYYIPKMTLQPLVENAISHGLEKVTRKGLVTVRIFATDRKVVLQVSDNGIGMSETELDRLNERMKLQQVKVSSRKGRNNGIAVMNVNARIRLTFGEEYGIHYRSVENVGTEAVVTLPKVDEFARVQYEDILMTERE